MNYDLFDHDGTGILELQKDDEAGFYESDDEAWADFLDTIRSNNMMLSRRTRAMAAELLDNWRPYMLRMMRRDFEDPHT